MSLDPNRRRGTKRPATAEETHLWSKARLALDQLQSKLPTPDTITKVNKWMADIPHNPNAVLPEGGYETLRSNLVPELKHIKSQAEEETLAIREALDHLSALIALRKGIPEGDKRIKRIRISSPTSTASPPLNGPSSTSSSTQNGARMASQGPGAGSTILRDARAKKEHLIQQLPLQPGRKVAFKQPSQSGKGGGDTDGDTWILAVVKRCVDVNKNKYEVQDDDNEDGEPGQIYTTSLRNILPLPDSDSSPNSPSHPNAYDEYPAGAAVMGLYPDTSCFYRAIVVTGPRDPQPGGNGGGGVGGRTVSGAKHHPMYRLKFEDDDDQIRAVGVQWVVDAPP